MSGTCAWDLYQRGMWHLYRYTGDDLKEARRYFRSAVDRDPRLGAAYSGIAESFYFSLVYGFSTTPEQDRQEALAAARRAVRLDDEDPGAHCALGRAYYVRREHHLAIPELEIALTLNPSLAGAHYGIGAARVFSGRAKELLTRRPDFSTAFVRKTHLFVDQSDMSHYLEGLRKAGVS